MQPVDAIAFRLNIDEVKVFSLDVNECSTLVRQPANKNVPTNPLLGGTVGSRGSFLLAAMPKGDLMLSYFA